MTMGTVPIIDFRGLPQSRAWGHGELGPPHPCRMEAGAGSDDPTMTEHGIYVPGHPFAMFIQVSNRGRNGCIKSWFCQYISLPMKYTVSGIGSTVALL